MAWIKVDQTIRDNKKVFALADDLDIDPSHAIGLLVSLWVWSVDNAPDGDMSDLKPRTIARAAGWTGDPDALIAALADAGLFDDGHIHDWNDYTGEMLQKKAADAEKKRSKYVSRKSQDSLQRISDSPQRNLNSPQILRGENEEKTERISDSPLQDKDKDKDIDKELDTDKDSDKEKEAEGYIYSTHAIYNQPGSNARARGSDLLAFAEPPDIPPGTDGAFEAFWEAYPKKSGKEAARQAWYRIRPDPQKAQVIVNAVQNQKLWKQWQEEGGRYIPKPQKWLDEGHWDDEQPQVDANFAGDQKMAVISDFVQREKERERRKEGGVL